MEAAKEECGLIPEDILDDQVIHRCGSFDGLAWYLYASFEPNLSAGTRYILCSQSIFSAPTKSLPFSLSMLLEPYSGLEPHV